MRHPVPIIFGEAIAIALLGLCVNLSSAWLLHDDDHHHGHGQGHDHAHAHEKHDHDHDHGARHRDNNLRAAYIHVLADAATSVLAIAGLSLAWIYGWLWMDPLAGIIGALVIANWSYGLVRDTSRVLLDVAPEGELAASIRERLESGGDRIADLHLWQVGPGHVSAIISLVTHAPRPPSAYKAMLAGLESLSHVTVEVQACEGGACR
jgi:cation diffusion facilitator family transporter